MGGLHRNATGLSGLDFWGQGLSNSLCNFLTVLLTFLGIGMGQDYKLQATLVTLTVFSFFLCTRSL